VARPTAALATVDDGRGWLADVEHVVAYDWGQGKHLGSVPAERVRLA
jgi:hypothetical protein